MKKTFCLLILLVTCQTLSAQSSTALSDVRDPILKSLEKKDPQGLIKALKEAGPELWNWIPPGEIMTIAGPDALISLDNIFFHLQLEEGTGSLPWALALASQWKANSSQEILRELTFYNWSQTLEPEDLRSAYIFFKAKGLPLENLVLHVRARAGLLEPYTHKERSATVEEIAFRALLIRLGLSGPEILSPPSSQVFSSFPEIEVLYSAARVYAGIPTPRDKELLQSYIMTDSGANRVAQELCAQAEKPLQFSRPSKVSKVELTISHPDLGPIQINPGSDIPNGQITSQKVMTNNRPFQTVTFTSETGINGSWVIITPKKAFPINSVGGRVQLDVIGTGQNLKMSILVNGPENQLQELPVGRLKFYGPKTVILDLPAFKVTALVAIKIYAPLKTPLFAPSLNTWSFGLGKIVISTGKNQ